jgi:hypothetical protein
MVASPVAPGQVDLFAPSERPEEPVTAGAVRGPGPGPEALGQSRQAMSIADELEMLATMPGAGPNVMKLAQTARQMNL